MKRSKGEIISIIIMILLPLTALGYLYYCLETYTQVVHNDSGTLAGAHAVGCMVVNFILWMKMRRKGRIFSIIAAAALFLLIFVLWVASKIPFCVECDHVTADDLGFLIHWIEPYGA